MQIKHNTGVLGAPKNHEIAERILTDDGSPIAPQAKGQSRHRPKDASNIATLCRRIFHSGAQAQKPLVSVPQGQNGWDQVTPSDFGPEWDYELENHITKWIVTPVSKAALEWCDTHFPADAPRWGAAGFVIEAERLSEVVNGMTRDGLMSPEEYEMAMQEENMLQLQGEGRE